MTAPSDKDKKNSIKLFEEHKVRTAWNNEEEKWYFHPYASPGGGTGVTIEDVNIDENNHLIFSYSNGTTQDAGEISISRVATTCLYTPEGDECVFGIGGATV